MNGQIFAFMTADAVTLDAHGRTDTDESSVETGWIDPQWSMHVLHDSRNDVRPLVNEPADSQDLAEWVRDALIALGTYEDEGEGHFYGLSESSAPDGRIFSYAVHFTHKYRDSRLGWIEVPWSPAEHGIEV